MHVIEADSLFEGGALRRAVAGVAITGNACCPSNVSAVVSLAV